MSGKDEASSASGPGLDEELEKAMSEAEAAVEAVRSPDTTDGNAEVAEIEPEVDLEAELEQLQADNAALRDKWLRAVADQANHSKRVKREMEDGIQQATARLLESFLPTVDNLERAMEAATDPDSKLVEGIKMVIKEFLAALARQNILPIESVGETFDPNLHDAVQQIDSPDHPPGVVVQEFEKGYRRGARLLRPSRVVVAGPGSTGAPAEQDGDGEESADA